VEKVFVVGDIHGGMELLEKILQYWNDKEEQLVFLGDFVDRGPDSLKVIQKVMELTEEYGAIALCGNHEQLFLKWLQYPEKLKEYYFNAKIGGINTIESFLNTTLIKYEKWKDGKLIDTELQEFCLRWYGVEEFTLLLKDIGFTNITCSSNYAYGKFPTHSNEIITFEAEVNGETNY